MYREYTGERENKGQTALSGKEMQPNGVWESERGRDVWDWLGGQHGQLEDGR